MPGWIGAASPLNCSGPHSTQGVAEKWLLLEESLGRLKDLTATVELASPVPFLA